MPANQRRLGKTGAMTEDERETTDEQPEDESPEEEVTRARRVKRRKTQNPPMTATELKEKVWGWGEKVGVGMVGFLSTLVGENVEKVEHMGERIADAFKDEEEEDEEEKDTE